MIELRPYQFDAVNRVEQALTTAARPLIVAPTGSGKTIMFAEIIKRLVAGHKRVLVLAHRREIIDQTSRKLTAHGVRHGIVMAGAEKALRPQEPVQVASIQTLWSRGVRSSAMQMPLADLIVVDEAHHTVAKTYSKILETYPDAMVLGCTATPCRGDGRGLGSAFTTLIEAPQVAELIAGKFLVGAKVYAPVDPNLKGVRTQSGDYVVSQLSHRMNTDQLVGDIVTHWLKHGERRRTVAFAVDVAHSIHIKNEFVRANVRAEHLDGGTPIPEREAILGRLASGETEVVSNCMVLTEGWDMPEVGCCILARPTKQMGLYRQMIGRVLRPADGKTHAIVLDHSGAVFRHGLPEDHVEWTLLPDHLAQNPAHEARKRGEAPGLHECPGCGVLKLGGQPCSNCGWEPRRRGQGVDFADGELGLIVGGKAKRHEYSAEERERWHGMLTSIAQERNYKRGWIAHKYKEKFGTWPSLRDSSAITPTHEVRSWVRSRNIAYAKRRAA
jgi:DNA repair protein RadD